MSRYDINQSKSKLLQMIKPAYLKMFDKDEWKALKEDATGPGGVDRLRRTIEEHDWFAPFMNKGGAVKNKMNKGLTALKKEAPDVVKKMGYKKGGSPKKMAMGGMMPMQEQKINPTTGMTMKYGGMPTGKARTGHMDMRKNGMFYGGMTSRKMK